MRTRTSKIAAVVLTAAAAALGGCTVTHLRMNPDFGEAVAQDTQAQITDPNARYPEVPTANAERTSGALVRYEKDNVIQPATSQTATPFTGATQSNTPSGGAAPSTPQ